MNTIVLLLHCIFLVGVSALPFRSNFTLRETRSVPQPLSCNTCYHVFNLAKKALHTSNQQKFTLSKVCNTLGNLNSACNEVSHAQVNNLYQHIEDKLNTTEFCVIEQKCDSSSPINEIKVSLPEISIPKVTPNGDPKQLQCELCKGLVDQRQSTLLSDNKEQFQNTLSEICKENEDLKGECQTVVEIASSHIYDYFINKLKLPEITCTAIGLCSGPGPSAAIVPLPVPNVAVTRIPVPIAVPVTDKPRPIYTPQYTPVYRPPIILSPQFQLPDFSNVFAPLAAGGLLAGAGAGAAGGLGLAAVFVG